MKITLIVKSSKLSHDFWSKFFPFVVQLLTFYPDCKGLAIYMLQSLFLNEMTHEKILAWCLTRGKHIRF